MIDKKYMQLAIDLAKNGEGRVHPNPLVGAVIVKDDRIIGQGWHEYFGGLHAERNAIKNLTESAEGATIYVTLEPCCHHGKTPPCTDAIIENRISRVVVGSRDPNPKVSGGGVAALRAAGIEVIEDFLREECDCLNPVFFHYIQTHLPYVTLKYAMTMDGKIATKTGASKWITGEAARRRVHEMRHAAMAIMTGIGTVISDDPMLNARIEGGADPIRVICDSRLSIPLESNIVKSAGEIDTIVFCAYPFESDIPGDKRSGLEAAGIRVVNLPGPDGRVDLCALVKQLGSEGIDSIMIECGGAFAESAVRCGIVDEIKLFMAPKIFGGRAMSPVEGEGVELPSQASLFNIVSSEIVDGDLLVTYRK